MGGGSDERQSKRRKHDGGKKTKTTAHIVEDKESESDDEDEEEEEDDDNKAKVNVLQEWVMVTGDEKRSVQFWSVKTYFTLSRTVSDVPKYPSPSHHHCQQPHL